MEINSKLKVKTSKTLSILDGYAIMDAYFSEGYLRVQNKDGLFGYIDKEGKEAIPCQFKSAGSFKYGYARVLVNNKWGYIDGSGNIVIPCVYSEAKDFNDFFALTKIYNGSSEEINIVIDSNGKTHYATKKEICCILWCGYMVIRENIIRENNKYKIYDINGNDVWPDMWFDQFNYIGETCCFATLSDERYLIKTSGFGIEKIKLDKDIHYLYEIGDGIISAYFGKDKYGKDKYGFIDTKGRRIFFSEFYSIPFKFNHGFSVVKNRDGYYIIDSSGRRVSGNYVYEYLSPGDNYLFLTDGEKKETSLIGLLNALKKDSKKPEKCGYINQNGETVIPFDFDMATPFSEGFAFAALKEEDSCKWYVIDEEGNKLTKTSVAEVEVSDVSEIPPCDSFEITEYISEVKAGEDTTIVRSKNKDEHDRKLAAVIRQINMDTLSAFINPGYSKKPTQN